MSEPVAKKAKTKAALEIDVNAKRKYLIGTRKSNLAMWQANHVNDALNALYPDSFEVLGISTLGDKDQMKPLTAFDQKGVFTKELDVALLGKHIDLAVHCIKDLPTTLPKGLEVGVVLERGDREDCVIMHEKHKGKTLATLPAGAIVGTSALRREALVRSHFSHLSVKDIRGNVNTRLAKLDSGNFDAIILAVTGLKRLKLQDRISEVLDYSKFGYAVGQGALAVVIREGDENICGRLQSLEDRTCTLECDAERALLRSLNGGCKVPISVRSSLAEAKEEEKEGGGGGGERVLTLWGCVATVDGSKSVESSDSVALKGGGEGGDRATAIKLGETVAAALLKQGAAEILEHCS